MVQTGSAGVEEQIKRAILVPPRIWKELDSLRESDKNLQSKFIRALRFLSSDIRHPSLQVEMIRSQKETIYRARVDLQHRIHFELNEAGYYVILEIGGHRLQGIG